MPAQSPGELSAPATALASPPALPPARTVLPWLLAFLVPLTLLRLFLGTQMDLSPDEAYYKLWSERLDWSYYSKGPGVAVVIRAGTALLGHTELGVRLLSPFLALGTSLLAWAWVRRRFGEPAALFTLAVLNCAPIFNVGAVVLTIDPLSIFFWMASLVTLTRGLEEADARPGAAWPWWFATGLLTALGFLCKYTNAFFLLGAVLVLITLPEGRRLARTASPWALLAGFLALCWPPLVWNARHGWITVTHLEERGVDKTLGPGFRPLELAKYLGMHAGVYSPLIFILLMVVLVVILRLAFKRAESGGGLGKIATARLLACFAAPIMLLYFALSLNNAGEPNWTAPGCFTLVLGAGWVLQRWLFQGAGRTWKLALTGVGLALGLILSVLVTNVDLLRQMGVPIPYERDPGARLRGWRTAAVEVERLRSELESEIGRPVFLVTGNYQVAAALSFYLPEARRTQAAELPRDPRTGFGHPPVYMIHAEGIQNQFSFWPDYLAPGTPWLGGTALYVSDKERDSPPEKLVSTFDTTAPLSLFEITRRGSPVHRFTIFTCRGLKQAQAPGAAEPASSGAGIHP